MPTKQTVGGVDPQQTNEWTEALDEVIGAIGLDGAVRLLDRLSERARAWGADLRHLPPLQRTSARTFHTRGRLPGTAPESRHRRSGPRVREIRRRLQETLLKIPPVGLSGDLMIPAKAAGIVLFAHGSGSSRHSRRNRYVASVLQECPRVVPRSPDLATGVRNELDATMSLQCYEDGIT